MIPQPFMVGGKSFVFRPTGGATNNFQAYNVRPGVTAIGIIAIGGGGGGGNGFSAAAAAARGGGGGGGGGGIVRATIPAIVLPDTLWLSPGAGGASAAPGTSSTVYLRPSNTSFVTHSIYNVSFGGNGGTGTGVAAGSAGAAGSVGASGMYSDLALFLAIPGGIGVIGGAQTGAAGTANVNTRITGGGAGGAGVTAADFAGGAITATNLTPVIGGGAAGSNPGTAGFSSTKPLVGTGGSGGGASNTGVGGAGGDGGMGSGGGGGGGGTTGGAGGRGGDGIIIITEYY